ncbi:MAG: DUF4870 domain-containing protein [Nitriliruptorales bacterium]|nr:DUF4870 domain-containing protein [Nitriliruptorales bacterium]
MTDQPTTSCPNCGAGSPAQATFCATCGTPLTASSPRGGASPPASADESRMWAMGAHLSAVAGAVMGGLPAFVGPLVVWLIRRENDPFAAEHGREALNFNLTILLVVFAGMLLGLLTIGLGFIIVGPVLLILGVLWLIWTVQATIAASNRQPYRYPLTIRFISA